MLENLLQEGGLIIIFCSSAMGGHSWKGLRVLLQNLGNILVPIIFICCFGSCISLSKLLGLYEIMLLVLDSGIEDAKGD